MACTCMRHWSYNTIRSPTVASAGNVNSKVLVLGGTGRVGGSTALALSKLKPDLRIVIAGQYLTAFIVRLELCIWLNEAREKGANMVTTLGNNAEFAEVDINDDKSLDSALTDVDLVVHAAGPFQQTENCRVLEAAIRAKTAYLDVCDDTSYALRAKSFKDEALAAKVPAITTGGIYPGVSNVMAAELVRVAKEENKGEPERLRFYYYTAGTGGAGPTILATSFLLLGEEVIAYNKGEKIKLRPYSSMVNIDFGRGIGKKDVYLLNLPEVTSTHEVLGVPTVSARFGTAPFFWNWAMDAMTLMAAELVRVAKEENKGEPERLRFYYYTAGTGGAGPTILATSFLLLGEEVIAYNKGEKIKLRPYSSMVNIDFGRGIGKKDVYLLNLPEVTSTHEVLGVPTVSARFGTAPFFWNWAMDAMTRFVPSEVLRDRSKVQEMVRLFDPVVRVIDGYAGERVSIRADGKQLVFSLIKDSLYVDLVVHAAGPFQQTENCRVLEAAIRAKTAYLDVCDDTSYALRAKSFKDEALAAKVPAITTGGIYPGVSNVMAAELVRVAKEENKGEPERLRFYYYTAGTGGAGPTILATSFLLLGEEVIAYNKGEKIKLRPYSSMVNIDFGRGIGKKDVYLLNLPEVTSTHEVLGVPTVSARFGTAPFFWNWAMDAMTRFVPSEVLRDRSKVQEMVRLFDPVVRVIDGYAGERVSLRVDLECSGGRQTIGVFTHKRLSVSVGYSTAAFALAILEGSTQPGVWFPEEVPPLAHKLIYKNDTNLCINAFLLASRDRH
ncbi:saccharopine dehydrogenase [Artemisia annua]|uniref:Saccharopine dehydrogenase n=1 Tax=Artemisia annua TaxID=35608 RepID=A0A2U1P5V3_ARTAN|nr:saccharopine dehydrogenase [Artemisia annua]